MFLLEAKVLPIVRLKFYRSIGRGYKLDRQEIIGLLVAFDEWMEMDHDTPYVMQISANGDVTIKLRPI